MESTKTKEEEEIVNNTSIKKILLFIIDICIKYKVV